MKMNIAKTKFASGKLIMKLDDDDFVYSGKRLTILLLLFVSFSLSLSFCLLSFLRFFSSSPSLSLSLLLYVN